MLAWAAAFAVLLGAVAQSATGFGFGLVAGPFLIAFLGPQLGVRQSILLACVINVVLLAEPSKRLEIKPIAMMASVSLAATPLFVWGRRFAPVELLAGLAALATLAGVGMIALGFRRHWMGGRSGAILAGLMGALMNLAAGIAGPPAVLHAASAGWGQQTIRSSLQIYFLALNLLGLALLGLPQFDITLAGALIAGLVIGRLLVGVLEERWARVATLSLAAAGAAAAAARALF